MTANDGVNPAVTSNTTVAVGNLAPTITAISAPVDPVAVRTGFNVDAPFTDAGANDTHTCTVDWGDGHSSSGAVAAGACSAKQRRRLGSESWGV